MKYSIKKAYADVLDLCKQGPIHVTMDEGKVVLDPTILLEPVNWAAWIMGLRFAAFINQGGMCVCGEQLRDSGELHHALITKADLSGYHDSAKNKVMQHSYNVVLCHPKCHISLVRRKCLVFLRELYGEKVLAWYANIPAKSFMRRIM